MIMCLWPGLPAAWIRGDLRGLVLCIGFGWATSLLLLATFVWPEWIAPLLVNLLWCAIGIVWLAEAARSCWKFKQLSQPDTHSDSPAFLEAQEHYIRGNWFDAEAVLLRIISQTPRDAEAQLLLASVLRHTKRWQAALRRLDQLEFLQAASSWRYEIQQERVLLKRAMADEAQLSKEPQESEPGSATATADGENTIAADSDADSEAAESAKTPNVAATT